MAKDPTVGQISTIAEPISATVEPIIATVNQPGTQAEPIDVEAIKAQLKAEFEESLKKETSGRDRTITELNKKLEELHKSSLTESERSKFEIERQKEELEKRQQELEQRESEYTRLKLRDYAGSILAEKGLTNGMTSEQIDGLKEMVYGSTNEDIKNNVERLIVLQQQATKNLYAGSTPPTKGGTTQQLGNNPFSKESFNLTEQMRITKEDPEQAKLLKEAAKGK